MGTRLIATVQLLETPIRKNVGFFNPLAVGIENGYGTLTASIVASDARTLGVSVLLTHTSSPALNCTV